VTLSEPQAALARERAASLGLADRVEIRVTDYRELGGRHFDKVASVGMYEHVGSANLPAYAASAFALLRPGGLLLNHGIARLRADPPDPKTFIARYVFPDGELPALHELVTALEHNRLEVRDVESLREHYALTLRRWVTNLRLDRERAEALVGPERTRVWDLYMLGAARAFETAEIGLYQVLAVRQDGPHSLPLDRLELLVPREARALS
jgi:cyclopropane-fatty-acyl-phospholipid synthase